MSKIKVDISVSVDGYVAGPNQSMKDPLGEGGNLLHEWALGLEAWREPHGREGGETGAESDLVDESRSATGATVMGRRMFSGGEGSWDDDPNARGWWGDEPPFHQPVFVLTHHPREPLEMEGGTTFTFVTDGIEAALAQAQAAARRARRPDRRRSPGRPAVPERGAGGRAHPPHRPGDARVRRAAVRGRRAARARARAHAPGSNRHSRPLPRRLTARGSGDEPQVSHAHGGKLAVHPGATRITSRA